MNEIKGKCKTCLGCNKLEDENFEGKDECKYYIKSNVNLFMIISSIITLLITGILITYGIYRFSILCGG